MRSTAFQRNKYTGELYKFVRESVGDTSTLKYYYVGNITLSAGVDKTNKMILKADEPIALGWLVRNIVDANGTPILDNVVWQVNGVQPITNSFGTIESYRMRVIKFTGTI